MLDTTKHQPSFFLPIHDANTYIQNVNSLNAITTLHLEYIDFRSPLSTELKLCENLNYSNSAFVDTKARKNMYIMDY